MRQGESFFRARLVNAVDFREIENLTTPSMASAARNKCYTFKALASDARVDFIFSLADLNDMAWIDLLQETVNGNPFFPTILKPGR